ncbi:hypothetical protein M885DRAFT_512371 [Pelagophyceae sp. CCMP2097]|nr:hypothetical protein M885DRAFT_512371 [Pelagophyceae sp. CCMP2097]
MQWCSDPAASDRQRRDFIDDYLRRLSLADSAERSLEPSLALLAALIEAHLRRIPFETLDAHLTPPPPPCTLEFEALRLKLLHRRRGGNCFELNGLFRILLLAIGYSVELLPCRVFAGKERGRKGRPGYRAKPSHVALLVSCAAGAEHESENPERYFVDVGFGEAPLGPILYAPGDQETPEGMRSKIEFEGTDDARLCGYDNVELQWFLDGAWAPRLQWGAKLLPHTSFKEADAYLADFAASEVGRFQGPLTGKLVVCTLSRAAKVTVAGLRLKVTSPRFGGSQTVTTYGSVDKLRAALLQLFDIPLEETAGLSVDKNTPPDWWSHL